MSEQPETATDIVEPLSSEAPRGGSRTMMYVLGAVGLVVAAIVLWLLARK